MAGRQYDSYHHLSNFLPQLILLLVINVIVLCHCASPSIGRPNLVADAPSSAFIRSLESSINAIQRVTSVVSRFTHIALHDFRLSNAVSDCLDLLEFSAQELSWTLSAAQNPTGKDNSTGDVSSDLRTWLGAALGNQETCMEGFEGTNSLVKAAVAGGLDQITSLVRDVLAMLHPPARGGGGKGHDQRGRKRKLMMIKGNDNTQGLGHGSAFPHWIRSKDRKLLQATGTPSMAADVVVAADGSGNYTRVMDAVLEAPDYSSGRYIIYIKRGVYHENVEIKKKKWNLVMIGDGMDLTIITGNRSFVDGWTTFRSATFAVGGRGFMARDMTFENTAGPQKHQAVALRSDSDLSVFYRCGVRGYQDTLYAHSLRQFYRECHISGTVDFIFGDATAVFQNCQILAKRGLPNQKNTITAQGRRDPNQPSGFAIQFSNISADSDLLQSNTTTTTLITYLGRPWKLYSRTIIMQSYISSAVRPEGWLEWNGDFALDTLFYAEYLNYGPSAGLGSRVRWAGFHPLNDSSQAANFTVAQFIDGNLWLPPTGVRYIAGLTRTQYL
ncbi:pectinesterase/pectinesterase inhibitor PPE8B-like isoform X2 [Malania oleifera]|uniref:pectinesterase/pectinesterase inhibitor PPE8B-like isoform X2 n=1 Tax=Malania oleifera TaxID=397392 RepID=UPI0025ADE117|nr:pectinesterase/pectinesterase inhibitor PPE8B-like isoform X2 [Malania oleifera]